MNLWVHATRSCKGHASAEAQIANRILLMSYAHRPLERAASLGPRASENRHLGSPGSPKTLPRAPEKATMAETPPPPRHPGPRVVGNGPRVVPGRHPGSPNDPGSSQRDPGSGGAPMWQAATTRQAATTLGRAGGWRGRAGGSGWAGRDVTARRRRGTRGSGRTPSPGPEGDLPGTCSSKAARRR